MSAHRLRDVLEITGHGARRRIGSRSALAAALLLALTAVAVVDGVVSPVEALADGRAADPADAVLRSEVAASPHLVGLVAWATHPDAPLMTHLLEERPALLSGVWIVLLLLLPFLVAAWAFDQTASDIGTRWHRFVLFRSRRSSVFVGRLLSSALTLTLLIGLACAAVVAYVDLALGLYPRGELWSFGLQGFVALVALSLPYVALCSLTSSASRSGVRALGLAALATALPILGVGLLAGPLDAPAWADLVHPFGWKLRLLHPDLATRTVAYAAMGGFTALLAFAGGLVFERRDL